MLARLDRYWQAEDPAARDFVGDGHIAMSSGRHQTTAQNHGRTSNTMVADGHFRSLEELLAIPPGDTETVRERVRERVRLDHPDDALSISPSLLS